MLFSSDNSNNNFPPSLDRTAQLNLLKLPGARTRLGTLKVIEAVTEILTQSPDVAEQEEAYQLLRRRIYFSGSLYKLCTYAAVAAAPTIAHLRQELAIRNYLLVGEKATTEKRSADEASLVMLCSATVLMVAEQSPHVDLHPRLRDQALNSFLKDVARMGGFDRKRAIMGLDLAIGFTGQKVQARPFEVRARLAQALRALKENDAASNLRRQASANVVVMLSRPVA